jgi:hypothetical protein
VSTSLKLGPGSSAFNIKRSLASLDISLKGSHAAALNGLAFVSPRKQLRSALALLGARRDPHVIDARALLKALLTLSFGKLRVTLNEDLARVVGAAVDSNTAALKEIVGGKLEISQIAELNTRLTVQAILVSRGNVKQALALRGEHCRKDFNRECAQIEKILGVSFDHLLFYARDLTRDPWSVKWPHSKPAFDQASWKSFIFKLLRKNSNPHPHIAPPPSLPEQPITKEVQTRTDGSAGTLATTSVVTVSLEAPPALPPKLHVSRYLASSRWDEFRAQLWDHPPEITPVEKFPHTPDGRLHYMFSSARRELDVFNRFLILPDERNRERFSLHRVTNGLALMALIQEKGDIHKAVARVFSRDPERFFRENITFYARGPDGCSMRGITDLPCYQALLAESLRYLPLDESVCPPAMRRRMNETLMELSTTMIRQSGVDIVSCEFTPPSHQANTSSHFSHQGSALGLEWPDREQ